MPYFEILNSISTKIFEMDSSFLYLYFKIFHFFKKSKFDRSIFGKPIKPVPPVFPVFMKTDRFLTDISIHASGCIKKNYSRHGDIDILVGHQQGWLVAP
jgi:hypothetical protein